MTKRDGLGSLRHNPVYQGCVAELERFRIQHRIEWGGRHPHLVFMFRGIECRKPISTNPKAPATKKAPADIRRMIRDIERSPRMAPGQASVFQAGRAPTPPRNIRGNEAMNDIANLPAVRTVDFRGASIGTFEIQGEPHVALKPIAEGMGLDWRAQRKRLLRDPALSSRVVVTTTVAQDGRSRDMTAMPLKYLNGFLFGIDALRVRDDIRQRVIDYQLECYDVLDAYWRQGRAIERRETVAVPAGSLDLSSEAAAAIGGIVKVVARKAIEDLIVPRLEAARAANELVLDAIGCMQSGDRSVGPVADDMVTAFEIVTNMAEVPAAKRYPGLAGQVASLMARYCARHGFQARLIDLRPGEKLIFPRQAVLDWLTAGGRHEIWSLATSHADRKARQGTLKFRSVPATA